MEEWQLILLHIILQGELNLVVHGNHVKCHAADTLRALGSVGETSGTPLFKLW
jgi:hypothetical protein